MSAVAAALAAAAVVAGLLLPAAAAAAPVPEPSPTPTPGVPAGTTAFTLSPLSNGVVEPGESLSVSVSRQNGTNAELAAAGVTLALGSAPLADRAALGAWLDDAAGDVELQTVATEAIEAVDPGSFRVRVITIAADDPVLASLTPGVYPLAASYEDATGTVTSTSTVIVPRPETDAGVGVVVPITAGPRTAGVLTADELADLTAPDGDLTNQLEAVVATAAILAVDPSVVASIRALGSAAPESAEEWLARLEALPNSRFALQYGDADVSAQLQAGLPRLLVPTSFTAYMDAADFSAPGPTPTPTPTGPTPAPSGSPTPAPVQPTAQPTEPAPPTPESRLPTTEELLDLGPAAQPGVYWPADGTADADTVARLGALSADDIPSLTLLPSATTSTGAAGGTVPARARVGDAEALVFDSDVSTALREASERPESWLRGAPLTTATAYLAFATAEATAPLLVTVGRGDDRSRIALGAAVAAALEGPGVTPRTLPVVAAAEPAAVDLTDVPSSAERAEAASTLVAEESEIARFATILDDPALLTGPERAEILQVLGAGWVDDAGWPDALAGHRAQSAETLDSVALLPTSPSDLYGSSAGLLFWVRNDLEYPVNLVLYTMRDNLRIDVQSETPVVATPQSNTRVEVPVQSRVGRGEVTLTLQLRSPAFVAIGEPETVEVNVWADWEAVGIGALAVIVGGLLVVGIVRTVLRMRRRGRGVDAASPRTSDDSGAGEEAP